MSLLLIAATLLTMQKGGVDFKLESETTGIDPARSVFVTLTLTTPKGAAVAPPDLRARVQGFSLAEEFAEEPVVAKDGAVTQVVNWKLVPEPCARVYRIAPLVVGDFYTGAVYFDPPPAREAVTGGIETDPKKDLPPLSLKLVGFVALALLVAALVVAGLVALARLLVRRVKEHRMSPIERAWAELDRLIRKGLPGRGKYKDFYVELTMVVRRYVQRKYGIRAPHLTTEEFLREFRSDDLRAFLESADMVKFAGVEATPEMADEATAAARTYLTGDSQAAAGKEVRA
ncbi:MAG: hypothetical protein IJ173_12170 [Kiritimatiellae bacterium]|nr:hypothetical protein [Kiritimatiellia bacterium]